jgi:hypothetical protein
MDVEIAEQLKITLEKELQKRFIIFEELTGLKIADVEVMRVHEMGGKSSLTGLRLTVEVE